MANQDDDEPETEAAMETDQENQSGLSEEQKNMIPTEMKPLPVVEPTRIEKERTKILEKLDKVCKVHLFIFLRRPQIGSDRITFFSIISFEY